MRVISIQADAIKLHFLAGDVLDVPARLCAGEQRAIPPVSWIYIYDYTRSLVQMAPRHPARIKPVSNAYGRASLASCSTA